MSLLQLAPDTTFYTILSGAPAGLVGTIAVRVVNAADGTETVARHTTDITEIGPGVYAAKILNGIGAGGTYAALWDLGNPADPDGTFEGDDLLIGTSPVGSTSTSSYADVAGLKARAGVLKGAWDDTTKVSNNDLQRFLDEAAGEIDAKLGGFGFAVPVTDPVAARALSGWNADMGLEVALTATWPGGTGPEAVSDTLKAVQARLAAYQTALEKGGLAAVMYLREQESGAASGAAAFWTTEPDYSPWLDDIQSNGLYDIGGGLLIRGPIGPAVHKGWTRF